MTPLTRRRVLSGVSAGGLLGTVALSSGWDAALTRQESGLTVTIDEYDASVRAGEHVGVTSTVENPTDSSVETTVDLIVGHDPERVSRITTTLEPGASRTLTQGFDSYPATADQEFPVRVEVDGDADERTVSVTGASALEETTPGGDLTVAPGTEVLFEVGAVDPGGSQRTVWWVDGDQVGDSMGPWPATYYAETGAHFWRGTFEESGTTRVAAAVLPRDGSGTYAAHWEITVADDGAPSPTIDAARPAERTVVAGEDDDLEFELDVSDPEGGLDRVVWWLSQADAVLDVTDLAGETDTATLSLDGEGACHTCRVVPWVCCADGRFATLSDTWELRDAELVDDPGDSDDENEESDDESGDSNDEGESSNEGGDPGDSDDDAVDSNDDPGDSDDDAVDSNDDPGDSDDSGDSDDDPDDSNDDAEDSDDDADDSIETISCG